MKSVASKKQFPIFTKSNKNLIYLDSAATSQKPISVIEAEYFWYSSLNANVHRGAYKLAEEATGVYENSRKIVADFIGAKYDKEIVFTSGTTESINLVSRSWAKHNLKKGDTILLTEMEHHANIVPWQLLAQEMGFKIKYWPINSTGTLDMQNPAQLLKGVKFLSLTHVSNVLGTINNITKIISLAHSKNVKVLVDAAQSVSHMPINVQKIKPDFLVFSSHKMLGPTGLGVLYINQARHKEMKPYQAGGEMISEVSYEKSTFKKVPWLLEAGTGALSQVYSLSKAIEYLNNLGMKNVNTHIRELTDYAYFKLSNINGINIYGPKSIKRLGLISFTVDGLHAHDLSTMLDRHNIAVRAGHHCAMPLHKKLGISATVRASFSVYNTKSDINKLAKSLKLIIREWNKHIKE